MHFGSFALLFTFLAVSSASGTNYLRKDEALLTDEYIVVFKDTVINPKGHAEGIINNVAGASLMKTYEHAIKGFAAQIPPQALQGIMNRKDVDYVEPNQVVTANAIVTESADAWGLDRIDQPSGLNAAYSYDDVAGSGVDVYIIDTGIRATHEDFGGRVFGGYNTIGTTNIDRGAWDDCNGHGTHVASTAGGVKYGVAKQVNLWAVRVLDCGGSGTTSTILDGMDWVVQQHNAKKTTGGNPKSVVNMSLGYGQRVASADAGTKAMTDAGVIVAIAAGNSNTDACGSSPYTPDALTVMASTSSDARSSFSNFGRCGDLFAPGSSIKAAWITSNTSTNTISGTSMASPHVAGAAALYIDEFDSYDGSYLASQDVVNRLLGKAARNKISNAGSESPNLILQSPVSTSNECTVDTFVTDCTECPTGTCSSGLCTFESCVSATPPEPQCRDVSPSCNAPCDASCCKCQSYFCGKKRRSLCTGRVS